VGIDQSIPMIYTLLLLYVKTKKEIVGDGRVFPLQYEQLAEYGRKEMTNQIDILLQQHYLQLDSKNILLSPLIK
jgi:hypothetical protein